MMKIEQLEKILTLAKAEGFGPTALGVISACAAAPQNPHDFFRRSYRRYWSCGYFSRLESRGYLRMVDPPKGRRGYHWYVTNEEV